MHFLLLAPGDLESNFCAQQLLRNFGLGLNGSYRPLPKQSYEVCFPDTEYEWVDCDFERRTFEEIPSTKRLLLPGEGVPFTPEEDAEQGHCISANYGLYQAQTAWKAKQLRDEQRRQRLESKQVLYNVPSERGTPQSTQGKGCSKVAHEKQGKIHCNNLL